MKTINLADSVYNFSLETYFNMYKKVTIEEKKVLDNELINLLNDSDNLYNRFNQFSDKFKETLEYTLFYFDLIAILPEELCLKIDWHMKSKVSDYLYENEIVLSTEDIMKNPNRNFINPNHLCLFFKTSKSYDDIYLETFKNSLENYNRDYDSTCYFAPDITLNDFMCGDTYTFLNKLDTYLETHNLSKQLKLQLLFDMDEINSLTKKHIAKFFTYKHIKTELEYYLGYDGEYANIHSAESFLKTFDN